MITAALILIEFVKGQHDRHLPIVLVTSPPDDAVVLSEMNTAAIELSNRPVSDICRLQTAHYRIIVFHFYAQYIGNRKQDNRSTIYS